MNTMIRLVSAIAQRAARFAIALHLCTFAISDVAMAQTATTAPQQKTTQKICSFDVVDDSLPPATSQQTNSPLSYLQGQGFTQNPDGSWVCYVNDEKKDGRYYTLFKVQQVDKKLVATSFLDSGNLMSGQDNRSLDFFTMLINNHTNTSPENRKSIRRYLDTFISLVKQGKIPASRRAYLFDQPNRGFVIYHSLAGEKLKGTAITININLSSQRLGSFPAF
ncbi:MAG: hypothetical protein DSM106950_30290 [Stigonema ocellatum SAG 48.90 = DSM 106950]|nr:hypothetical protein [Stigonema ocellatum SAG 48.90 = DSM 106950]